MPEKTTTNETLGDLLDQGYGLNGHCLNCNRNAPIDVQMLVDRLGRKFIHLFGNLELKMRCTNCGQKQLQINLAAPLRYPSRNDRPA